jgi:hypothetical protein
LATDWIELEIINWDKYNARSDRKKHSWFRLANTIGSEPKFFGMSASQKWIAVCLFAEASKEGGGSIKIHTSWLADHIKVKAQEIHLAIQILENNGVVRLPVGNQSVSAGSPTDRQTDRQSTVTKAAGYPAAFESLYRKYPRREGKTPGFKTYLKEITEYEREAMLSLAIDNYSRQKKGTEKRYLLKFSTFMNQWQDWVPENWGEPLEPVFKTAEQIEAENA